MADMDPRTTPEAVETWLTAPWKEAKARQEPLPDEALEIIDSRPAAPSRPETRKVSGRPRRSIH